MASIHGDEPAEPATESISEAIVQAVAELEGTDPMAFDVCLYDVVDPDALETLVYGSSTLERLEFTFRGHRIVVDGNGNVAVGERPR